MRYRLIITRTKTTIFGGQKRKVVQDISSNEADSLYEEAERWPWPRYNPTFYDKGEHYGFD